MAAAAPRSSSLGRYYTGCAVWAYGGWVGRLYPPGSAAREFLRLYGQRFNAVEGNTTFYSLPTAATVARWAEALPSTFRFCPKLPRVYSHQGPLVPHREATRRFLAQLDPLGERLGPVMVQLPPSYGPDQLGDLDQFLMGWPHPQPVAVEVRHPAWFAPAAARALNQCLAGHQAARTLLDTRPIYEGAVPGEDPQVLSERKKPQLPVQPVRTANFVLVRYISHPVAARNTPYLNQWAGWVRDRLAAGTSVYWFAHCPQEEHSPAVAHRFYQQLRGVGAALRPLTWEPGKFENAGQLDLF